MKKLVVNPELISAFTMIENPLYQICSALPPVWIKSHEMLSIINIHLTNIGLKFLSDDELITVLDILIEIGFLELDSKKHIARLNPYYKKNYGSNTTTRK